MPSLLYFPFKKEVGLTSLTYAGMWRKPLYHIAKLFKNLLQHFLVIERFLLFPYHFYNTSTHTANTLRMRSMTHNFYRGNNFGKCLMLIDKCSWAFLKYPRTLFKWIMTHKHLSGNYTRRCTYKKVNNPLNESVIQHRKCIKVTPNSNFHTHISRTVFDREQFYFWELIYPRAKILSSGITLQCVAYTLTGVIGFHYKMMMIITLQSWLHHKHLA